MILDLSSAQCEWKVQAVVLEAIIKNPPITGWSVQTKIMAPQAGHIHVTYYALAVQSPVLVTCYNP